MAWDPTAGDGGGAGGDAPLNEEPGTGGAPGGEPSASGGEFGTAPSGGGGTGGAFPAPALPSAASRTGTAPAQPAVTPPTPLGQSGQPGQSDSAPPVPPAPGSPYASPAGGSPYAPPAAGSAYAPPPLPPQAAPAFGPPAPPPVVQPPVPAAPPVPPDGLRAAAVAVLNLSGLGLGYALTRRWFAMLVCWAATAALLFTALPADADGVSSAVLAAYGAFLVLAAVHGGMKGLRTRLLWPPRAPVALLLGLVLLAAPAGAAVAYGGAKDEATQKMLLDRLEAADHLVQTAKAKPFAKAQPDYRSALSAYRDLSENHPGSRAAARVPDRLTTYYKTVGAPYDRKKYCDAIAPLTYLRTVPAAFGRSGVGALASWPDDRLATSLYECGVSDLAKDPGVSGGSGDHLSELLTMFPRSPQAVKVEPAVKAQIAGAAKALHGNDPCGTTDRLRGLATRATALPGDNAGISSALAKDARQAGGYVESGTYTCGVDQYKSGEFRSAADTMGAFAKKYPHDRNRPLAQKIAIAAEIAETDPAAGRRMPTTASGGGIPVTISNDSPEPVEVLYTGPVTGSFSLPGCGSCHLYSNESTARTAACKSGKSYPKKTIELPPGTVYFLHKSGRSSTTPGSDSIPLRYGYTYTECAFTVQSGLSL